MYFKKRKCECGKYKTFQEADNKNISSERSTILFVPFFIPEICHGLCLSYSIRKIFDPCTHYKIVKSNC